MNFEILKATVISIAAEVQHSEKFSTREFVVSDNESKYPQFIKLQCVNDKCTMLNGYVVGSLIDIKGDIRGRQWTNAQGEAQTFNTLNCWSIKRTQVSSAPTEKPAQEAQQASSAPAITDDDLPF